MSSGKLNVNVEVGKERLAMRLYPDDSVARLVSAAQAKYHKATGQYVKIICLQRDDGSTYDDNDRLEQCIGNGDTVKAVWKAVDGRGDKESKASPMRDSRRDSRSGDTRKDKGRESTHEKDRGGERRGSDRDSKRERERGGDREKDKTRHHGKDRRSKSSSSSSAAAAAPPPDAAEKMTLTVFIPALNATTNFIFKRGITVRRACELILEKLNDARLDTSLHYGMCKTTEVTGFGEALPSDAYLGTVLQHEDVVSFGAYVDDDQLQGGEGYSEQFLSAYRGPDFTAMGGTRWDNGIWLAAPAAAGRRASAGSRRGRGRSRAAGDAEDVFVTVHAQALGVKKATRFVLTQKVSNAIEEFAAKVDLQDDPSAYGFFYVPWGLDDSFEVEMNGGDEIALYTNHLMLTDVAFKKRSRVY